MLASFRSLRRLDTLGWPARLGKPAPAVMLAAGLALCGLPTTAPAVTPIYVSLHSHNEDAGYWRGLITSRPAYLAYRADLVERVQLALGRGATFNWQSDHPVLRAIAAHEPGEKNLLRWMSEQGVEIDPHGHVATYNYADLAHLITALGVKPSRTIAGVTIYECGALPGTIAWLDWTEIVELQSDGTIHGRQFPDAVWTPDLLHGGAMSGHGYDDSTSGAWNCGPGAEFHTHQPAGGVTVIGAGYGADETLVGPDAIYRDAGYLYELAAKIASGELPADGFYTASVMVRDAPSTASVPDTNAALAAFLDAAQPLVDSGQVVYATLRQVREIWRTSHAAVPSQVGPERFSGYDEVVLEVCRDGPFACGADTCSTGEVCDPAAAQCADDCRLSYHGCASGSTCSWMTGLCGGAVSPRNS